MIKLADVPLALPNREILTDIERDLSLDKMLLLFSRAWPGPGMGFLATPTHYRRWPPWDKPGSILNRFYWPTGASRWGCGAFLATKAMCEKLHDACFGFDGMERNEVSLVLSTETGGWETVETVTVDFITVLPPIPLYRVRNSEGGTDYGLYMLVCVDVRYYWWNIPCPDLGITESAGKTWKDLIGSLGDAIEATIEVSEIPEYYLAPHRALNLTNEPVPPIIDAVAYNLGARFVATYAGDYTIQRFEDAQTKFLADLNNNKDRQYLGGARRYMDKF
jgi:hypothetical protein